MKAEELRIGNILLCNGFEVEIDCIQKNMLAKVGENFYTPIDQFEAIPLTEEILLRTDLQSEEDGFWDKEGIINFQIKLNECEVYYNGELLTFCYSFHELQNLFYALTGTELTINENTL